MLKGWRQSERGKQFRAQIADYADDFVILSRGKARVCLEWTRGVLGRLGLTLNEKKTSIRDAGRERFDFLGYTFGTHYSPRTGREYVGCSPSAKSVQRLREKVRGQLDRRNPQPWDEVCDYLNQTRRGWRQYFGLGSPWKAFKALDAYVEDRVQHLLRKRHKVSSHGPRQFSTQRNCRELGVYRLRGPLGTATS